MSIEVLCPHGHAVRVSHKFAGKRGLCPHSGKTGPSSLCRDCSVRIRVPLPRQPVESQATGQFVRPDPAKGVGESGAAAGAAAATQLPQSTSLCANCGGVTAAPLAACPWCNGPLTALCHLVLREEGDVGIVRLLDHRLTDALAIKELVRELSGIAGRRQTQHLVVDCSQVVDVSSGMLRALLALGFSVENHGGDLTLRKVGSKVRSVLQANELDHMFQIEEDRLKIVAARARNGSRKKKQSQGTPPSHATAPGLPDMPRRDAVMDPVIGKSSTRRASQAPQTLDARLAGNGHLRKALAMAARTASVKQPT